MRLEELKDLPDANGLLVLTTAEEDDIDAALLRNGFSLNLNLRPTMPGMWWMQRSAGDYQANFRYHPNTGKTKEFETLLKQGFVTRIDFFVPGPTPAIHDVVVALLQRGFRVAWPTLACDNHDAWEIFEPEQAPAAEQE